MTIARNNAARDVANLMRLVAGHLAQSQTAEACILLDRAERAKPLGSAALRAIADGWALVGQADRSAATHLRAASRAVSEPALVAISQALARGDDDAAMAALTKHLYDHPTDVAALSLLGRAMVQAGRPGEGERILRRALNLAPGFAPAAGHLAMLLHECGRGAESLAVVDAVLVADPKSFQARALKAIIVARAGDSQAAIDLYRGLLAERPRESSLWVHLGHLLNTVGDLDGSVSAYRAAIAQRPGSGPAWWGLANLKVLRFAEADIAAMTEAAAQPDIANADRIDIGFALGKAHEDAARWTESFANYAEANRLKHAVTPHDPAELARLRDRSATLMTPAFFAMRPGGCADPSPIFVVGMPRSGSTLVEQILASHPLIEGTMELPALPSIVWELAGGSPGAEKSRYPACLAAMSASDRARLGRLYVERASIHRRTDRPHFVDKLPNNFAYAGLISLILPNAPIIDVRRDPRACGFACFKQNFNRGQSFSYDLADLGRHIRDYAGMMDEFDWARPGRVHRIFYERLVGDLEGEVRRLLDHIGLPFNSACLNFHRTRRSVRTPSAGQVRRPIDNSAVAHWRHFSQWLGPLQTALKD